MRHQILSSFVLLVFSNLDAVLFFVVPRRYDATTLRNFKAGRPLGVSTPRGSRGEATCSWLPLPHASIATV